MEKGKGIEFKGYFYRAFDMNGKEYDLTKVNIFSATETQILFYLPGYGFMCHYATYDLDKIERVKL